MAQTAAKGPHLVVLQHGFEGTSFDMRALKAHLLFVFPTLYVHCAEGNGGKTYDSIDEMGMRLLITQILVLLLELLLLQLLLLPLLSPL